MENKKRASLHSGKRSQKTGRIIKPPHNDETREKNQNVNPDWVMGNTYWNCYDGFYTESEKADNMTFSEAELKFYNDNYQAALDKQNAKYIKNRQYKHIKKISDWLDTQMYAPGETVLRVGNVDDGFVEKEDLLKMVNEFFDDMNQNYGEFCHIINWVLHDDEYYEDKNDLDEDRVPKTKKSSPHVHVRYVFDYDDSGIRKIGIEKALEQANIEPPKPYKAPVDENGNPKLNKKTGIPLEAKSTRFNNRKMTFTALERKSWQTIIKKHGYDIETTPKPGKQIARDKEGFIAVKKANQKMDKALKMEAQLKADREILDIKEIIFEANSEETKKSFAQREAELEYRNEQCIEKETYIKKQFKLINEHKELLTKHEINLETEKDYLEARSQAVSEREKEAEVLCLKNQQQYEHLQKRKLKVREEKRQFIEYGNALIEKKYREYIKGIDSEALRQAALKASESKPMPTISEVDITKGLEEEAKAAVAEAVAKKASASRYDKTSTLFIPSAMQDRQYEG